MEHCTTFTSTLQSVQTYSINNLHETYYNKTNISSQPEISQYFVADGQLTRTNYILYNNFTKIANSTRRFNLTQFYDVARNLNVTVGYSQTKTSDIIVEFSRLDQKLYLTYSL